MPLKIGRFLVLHGAFVNENLTLTEQDRSYLNHSSIGAILT